LAGERGKKRGENHSDAEGKKTHGEFLSKEGGGVTTITLRGKKKGNFDCSQIGEKGRGRNRLEKKNGVYSRRKGGFATKEKEGFCRRKKRG